MRNRMILALLFCLGNAYAGEQCDYSVEPFSKVLDKQQTFPAEEYYIHGHCDSARSMAKGACKNAGFDDCSEVHLQDKVTSCVAHVVGKKYRLVETPAASLKTARCSKLFGCEQKYLCDKETSLDQLKKLQLVIEKHGCYSL